MKVLIACEYSGIVRDAFAALGHEAVSCDILPTDSPGEHYQGDVMDIINNEWDLMIAHPPCTYLCNSGVSWLYRDAKKMKATDRWDRMLNGAEFFKSLLYANIPKIAVENPIMHKYARNIVGANATQYVQPYHFGHSESKRTGLWLKNLPPLTATDDVYEEWKVLPKHEAQRLHYLPPSADRWKLRSATYKGIATAMAEQWGGND